MGSIRSLADGSHREVYMIFLLFSCRAAGGELKLNSEFADHAWMKREMLGSYDLNAATIETFKQLGVLA